MNPKLKLNLAAAGAGIALLGQGTMMISEAIAGPSLTGNATQTYNAGAAFSLQSGQSFEAIGNYAGTVTPFAVTENVSGITNVPVAATLNAGVSTLTAAFDRNGLSNTDNGPSIAIQAGIIQLGGNAPTNNVTTSSPVTVTAGLTKGLVLNQSSGGGVQTITLTGSGTDTGLIGASISSEAIGASQTTGSLVDSLTVINSLTAF